MFKFTSGFQFLGGGWCYWSQARLVKANEKKSSPSAVFCFIGTKEANLIQSKADEGKCPQNSEGKTTPTKKKICGSVWRNVHPATLPLSLMGVSG